MRRLFLVLAKLGGLFVIFRTFVHFRSLSLTAMALVTADPQYSWERLPLFGVMVIYACLAFAMAWLLLARTEWLADRLGITENVPIDSIEDDVILRTGVKLIGLFMIVESMYPLADAIVRMAVLHPEFWKPDVWQSGLAITHLAIQFLPAALQVAVGVFLTQRTGIVLMWITRDERVGGSL